MNFAENLKKLRKEKGLSQEELAEILDVSRQAVSRWELGEGYPEVEKLLLLSSKLNVSLDSLMATEIAKNTNPQDNNISGKIIISSPNENITIECYKVINIHMKKAGKNVPAYSLHGVGIDVHPFWGQSTSFLAWYASEELILKEIEEIQNAIQHGVSSYQLKYSAKVERKGLLLKIVEE